MGVISHRGIWRVPFFVDSFVSILYFIIASLKSISCRGLLLFEILISIFLPTDILL